MQNVPNILQYFWSALSDNWSWKSIYGLLRVAVLHRSLLNPDALTEDLFRRWFERQNKSISPMFHRLYPISFWSRDRTEIYGLFCELVAPQEWKLGYYNQSGKTWCLRNPCFTKFSVVTNTFFYIYFVQSKNV